MPEWTPGDRLRKAREYAELDQTQLGTMIGSGRRTISRAESGANVRRATMIAWALACGVSLHWIETGEAPPSGDDGGASGVRPKGFEPLTFC